MNYLATIVTLIGEIGVVLAFLTPQMDKIKKLTNGQKCQLRHDMLEIYYKNKESKKIHEYEYEHFVFLYEAYKALKGNSFIDKIYSEVKTWEIVL